MMIQKKVKEEKSFENLQQNEIQTKKLDMDFCMDWFQKNRNPNRILFPEKIGVIAPATKKYVTDTLKYRYPEKLDASHTAVLFITDAKMKHIYAHNLVGYGQLTDKQLSDLFQNEEMFRVEF